MTNGHSSVSVVVATLGRPELLACLDSLWQQSRAADEIIVVNNGNNSIEIPVPTQPQTRLIRCTKRGISAARNAGARIAEGEFLAFIDDDATADPDWLTAVEARFAGSPIAGMAGAVLRDATESSERVAVAVNRATADWFWKTNFGGIGNGANLAFRRTAFLAAGGFDEHLGLGATIPTSEEHNLFFRLVAAGETVAYEPDARVFHPQPEARTQRRRHLQTQRAAAAYVCYLWDHFPESRAELKKLLRRGRTPLAQHVRTEISPQWARWLYRGLGLADYLKGRGA